MMNKFGIIIALIVTAAHAARPFLEEPDTGLDRAIGDLAVGALPNLTDMVCLHDFDWAARNYLPALNYTYCMYACHDITPLPVFCVADTRSDRQAAGGEGSYRNNMEVFANYRFTPRQMQDVTTLNSTLPCVFPGYSMTILRSSVAAAHPDLVLLFWVTASTSPSSSRRRLAGSMATQKARPVLSRLLAARASYTP